MSETFAGSVERARGYIDCARSLFRDGFLSEAHEYMVKSLQVQLLAWGSLPDVAAGSGDSEPTAVQDRAMAALERSGYRKLERLRAAAAAVESTAPAPVVRARSSDLDWVWAEVERLTRVSVRQARTPRARKLQRLRRGAFAAVVFVLALLICVRLWGRPRAQASAFYSESYAATNAIDGLEATEWLLPDGASGWIDVRLPRARTVHRVRLLNSHNVFHADRAARAVRVAAFTEQGPAASAEGAFPKFSEQRSVLDLPIEAHDVTRVRVEVLSHFRSGGGLAEIEVD